MTDVPVERRRTGWDVVLGVLVVVAGLVILAHVVIATAVSVLFLGWLALAAGVFGLVGALFRIGKGGFWATALSGGLLVVLGLMLIRNPGVGALALTLVAGALFLAGGIVRIVAAIEASVGRVVLLFNGVIAVVLGLIVLLTIWESTLTLLGTLLGVQTLVDGLTLLLFGGLHVTRRRSGSAARR
jgi:uncharacterized membrane protein HdeD (DUF308 family)